MYSFVRSFLDVTNQAQGEIVPCAGGFILGSSMTTIQLGDDVPLLKDVSPRCRQTLHKCFPVVPQQILLRVVEVPSFSF